MSFLHSIYNFIKANKRIWIARLLVFLVIVGFSFIPYVGILPKIRIMDPGITDRLPYPKRIWFLNRFLWLPLSLIEKYRVYPWPDNNGFWFGIVTLLWWVFLSVVIIYAGNWLLRRIRERL